MANRDTTSTPYKNSVDGVCYFAYPTGDAPIVTVANYTQLRAKSSADAGFGNSIAVSDQYQKGSFKYAATQPVWGTGVDDGAMTIAASGGGWWVRQFTYSKTQPIELNWFESVVNNFDVTTLIKRLAEDFSPYFYVRVPDKPIKLIWNNPTSFDFKAAYGIFEFRLYESNSPVEIYFAYPDDLANLPAWKIIVIDLLIGSPTKKATYNDYLLTFTSTWTWTNRKFTDVSGSFVTPPPCIYVEMNAAYAIYGSIRCNTSKMQGLSFLIQTSSYLDFRLAGKYMYGSSPDFSGPGIITLEDVYLSDECFRKGGWTGTTEGLLDNSMSLARSGGIGTAVSGVQSVASQMKGKVTAQFCGSWGTMFIDYLGVSINEPFIFHMIDRGITGPNEFGKQAGVHIQEHANFYNNICKTDAFGYVAKNEQNKRFLKIINSYSVYGEYNCPDANWVDSYFIENNMVDDVENGIATHTKYLTIILVNSQGWNWQENGPDVAGVPQELDNIYWMGDGVNVACANKPRSKIVCGKQNAIRFAKIHNADLWDVGGVVENVNSTGKFIVSASANWTATNLTFSGTARNVIHFFTQSGYGPGSLAVTNFHAPVGSTITKDAAITATFSINGVTKTLPYTVQAGDLGTAVPDIPPNPLLGTA